MNSPNRHARRAALPVAGTTPKPRPHRFVDGWAQVSKSKRPDLEVAVLETVLVDTWSNESLRAGGWIDRATTKIHFHSPAPGFGPVRTLGLIARFVDFLRAKGTLDAWSHKYLRHRIEWQRVANQLIEGPPSSDGRDEGVWSSDLERLAARFAETLTHPIDRQIGAGVVMLAALALKAQLNDTLTHFGALDVTGLVNELLLHAEGSEEERGATPAFLRILADFYVWRGAEGRLDPARATELASQLRAAALAHGALRS